MISEGKTLFYNPDKEYDPWDLDFNFTLGFQKLVDLSDKIKKQIESARVKRKDFFFAEYSEELLDVMEGARDLGYDEQMAQAVLASIINRHAENDNQRYRQYVDDVLAVDFILSFSVIVEISRYDNNLLIQNENISRKLFDSLLSINRFRDAYTVLNTYKRNLKEERFNLWVVDFFNKILETSSECSLDMYIRRYVKLFGQLPLQVCESLKKYSEIRADATIPDFQRTNSIDWNNIDQYLSDISGV